MPLSDSDKTWYCEKIREIDPNQNIITGIDLPQNLISYTSVLRSDESTHRQATPEEFVHALIACILTSPNYNYPIGKIYHEQHYAHGRKGTLGDEVDYVIYDADDLPYALWEVKSAEEYDREKEDAIKYQLFGTAPLVGAPRLLVYASIKPLGKTPNFGSGIL